MKKNTYNYVKLFIEREGYLLLLKCAEGHIYEQSFHKFQRGNRCPICYNNRIKTFDYVKQKIENNDYVFINSDGYKNGQSKLLLKCNKGHIFTTTYNNFKKGCRCSICFKTPKHSIEYVSDYISKFDYELLSNCYSDNKSKIKLKCPIGHTYNVSFSNFKNQGRRCPICNQQKTISKSEKEIVTFIKMLYNDEIIENDRTIIKNPKTGKMLELDVYIPRLKKAIEFNGMYWHSDELTKIKDNEKKIQCKEKSIDLLVVDEKDWLQDKSKCLENIKSFICEDLI
jgi:hypothetical protein